MDFNISYGRILIVYTTYLTPDKINRYLDEKILNFSSLGVLFTLVLKHILDSFTGWIKEKRI